MNLLTLLLILLAVAAVLWIVNNLIPTTHRKLITTVVLAFVGLWVIISLLGPYLSQVKL